MGKPPVVAIAAALLGLAASVDAQQLDSINNMCNRFDHQCRCSCSMWFRRGFLALTSNSCCQEWYVVH